jgi:hypothetical protein
MPLLLTPVAGPPDLHGRLAALRRRWHRAVLVSGVCALAAGALGAVVLIGLLDAAVSFPALIRAALLVGLLAAGGLFLRRNLLRPWRELGDDLALALRIEAHFPTLNDALASTVEFLARPDDPATGSAALRRATRRLALRETEDCDFADLLDRRPARRAALALAAAALAAVPLALVFPAQARTALVRLLDPFGDHPWPPQTVLTLDAPDWLARGEPFVLRGRLSGVVPERAAFGFALDGTPATEQSVAVTPDDDGGSFVVRLEPNRVPRGFRYRVRANDAETAWRAVRVLPPPQLVPLDGRPSPLTHLDYPAYTDLPPRDLPDGGGSVECVTGTLVRVRAATDRPVARAWVELAADPPRPALTAGLLALSASTPAGAAALTAAGQAVWGRVPAVLDGAGERFELTFCPYVSGPYSLRFEDEAGIGGHRPLDVHVQLDPSPAVTLERPSASQDSLAVLPDATVPLLARAEDPVFAVRTVALEYRGGKDEPVQRLPLYDHQALGTALPGMLAAAPVPPLRLRQQLVVADRRLDLKQFRHAGGRPLREGDTLTLQVVADDFDDVTPGKPPGRSHEVELRVVGPAALQTELHKAEADIQRELQEMLKLQRDALEHSTAAETQRRRDGTLRPEDLDRLLQSEQLQQQLRNRLGNEKEGLRAAVDRLRRALRDNPLPRSPERDRLEALAAELERLAREELEPTEPLLAQARTERGPVAPEARKNGALPKAIEHQRESERTLGELLEQMKPWSDARELRTEAGALLRDQERAARERAELEAKLGQFGVSKDQLTPEQREQLQRLEERQSALADRSADLLNKLNEKLREKEKAKADKEAEAANKEAQAAERERQAGDPAAAGTPRAADLRRQAQALRQQAEEDREAAAALRREAEALAQARSRADSNPTLAGKQREAAQHIGANNLGKAKAAQDDAAAMLRHMQDALQEQAAPDADRLAKKLRAAEQELEQLIQDQERLQKQAQDAGRIADPGQRKQELERLAREQERLQERARELAQRLTRQRGEQAARELRRASRAMDQVREQLEQGDPAEDKQDDALDRLDDAQDELAQARKDAEEELQRELRAKLIDALKGLKERQDGHLAESERLFQAAKQDGWSRPRLKSLSDLARVQADLGKEVGPLVEKSFQGEKVIAHLLRQAAEAMAGVEEAVAKIRTGPMDAESWDDDRRVVQGPERLALRRLTQLLDVLKQDEQDRRSARGNQPGQGGAAAGGAGGDSIPALAQLKLLRALQAEVNERTEAFAKAHTDLSKLTPEERDELASVRRAQADLAALLEEAAPAEPPANPPAGEKK